MRKALAYAVIAIVLGTIIMVSPRLAIFPTFTPETSDTYGEQLAPQRGITNDWAKASEASAGVVPNYPTDLLAIGSMLLFSIALAFSVSFFLNRKRFVTRNENSHLST